MPHGIHFFMNPGPTNIPDRILRAMDRGAIDFTGAEFKAISEECFAGLKRVFKTDGTILAYAATGHVRNGILLAPLTGVLLTEMILQQPPTLPLEPYQAARLWQNAP